jgi:hypothetical protein
MKVAEIKKAVDEKLSQRDYYAIYLFIDGLSEEYLNQGKSDYDLCIELITQNQDLCEYMGASKQFEMAFELHNKMTKNRNRLFLSCFNNEQQELKVLFKRAVGDFSKNT